MRLTGLKRLKLMPTIGAIGRVHGSEHVVGLGLGRFDLVVVDEAHKSRSTDSMLSRLLETVIFSAGGRRLCMTATPIELDANQWEQTFKRLDVEIPNLHEIVSAYDEAARDVRQAPTDDRRRLAYASAADAFQKGLCKYVLRRDKRESPAILSFQQTTGLPPHAYRQIEEIAVETESLSPAWKQVVCAAEALSFLGKATIRLDARSGCTDKQGVRRPQPQRLRLTIGNGHGVAEVLDACRQIERGHRNGQDDGEAEGDAGPCATRQTTQSTSAQAGGLVS